MWFICSAVVCCVFMRTFAALWKVRAKIWPCFGGGRWFYCVKSLKVDIKVPLNSFQSLDLWCCYRCGGSAESNSQNILPPRTPDSTTNTTHTRNKIISFWPISVVTRWLLLYYPDWPCITLLRIRQTDTHTFERYTHQTVHDHVLVLKY